ncbi:erythromycin esterase family protein [Streptomyces coffeae]|uniref:Erythromycin esterase family protein n=1 Tax=Streptomyces coffeae TaxID=621382 RepID=A0ABS1NGI6_9ACTN|nr:erythromycin esterase family protein [Streptomyces coffeae]MBL1099198.1 erythromycin esterase family protein [Streptomyces coffeae]
MKRHLPILLMVALASLGALVTGAPAEAEPRRDEPALRALERAALPLRSTAPSGPTSDLRPLGRMVSDAKIVGLGEATHGSHEFFTMKHRVLRYLVRERGFRTFALEAPWSTGQRLDAYVLRGEGDPRRIMREEFQNSYREWNNREYLSLLTWMRNYNRAHPGDPVHFMGNDFGYSGAGIYDTVTDWVRDHEPALLPEFTELYRGLRPTVDVNTYMNSYLAKPLAERRQMAARTAKARQLLQRQRPDSREERDRFDWILQDATAIARTARGYAFDFGDPEQGRAAMRYRDRVMADNTVWWQRKTGDRILLSAHNAHIAYETYDPEHYPRMQGAFIRDRVGRDYVSIGFTFDRGAFNAEGGDGKYRRFTVGPAAPGSNEHTLDRVRHRDYLLDQRTVAPAARDWLATARPTRSIGTAYPQLSTFDIPLLPSHDVLIHLHRVTASGLLPD